MDTAITNYYKCPPKLVEFRVPRSLPNATGYFALGDETVCFGRTANGQVRSTPDVPNLYNALAHCTSDGDACTLSFDPTETADFLRLERYRQSGHTSLGKQLVAGTVRKAYYLLRPLLPVALRKYLQRQFLGGWDNIQFPRWPLDCTVDSMMEQLLALAVKARAGEPKPFIWFYQGAVIMTHDVETKKGLDFLPHLTEIDASFGLRSSFQIIPEKRYEFPGELLENIQSKGFEICIHGLNHDGHLFDDHKEFLKRVKKINRYAKEYRATGFRSPVLYRNLNWFADLEFSYDMSVPNVGHLDPQRGGCCTVMPYFIGDILELPVTTTQDYSLFHILNQYSTSLWQQQIDLILNKHGLVSFIVHPDYIISERPLQIYRRLLEHLSSIREERNVWFALPKQIDEWWRRRSRMELIETNGTWRISGPDAKHARIAYAKLVDCRITYEIDQTINDAKWR